VVFYILYRFLEKLSETLLSWTGLDQTETGAKQGRLGVFASWILEASEIVAKGGERVATENLWVYIHPLISRKPAGARQEGRLAPTLPLKMTYSKPG
jgi:hypothetical protein